MLPSSAEDQREYWDAFWGSTGDRPVDQKALARKLDKQGGLVAREIALNGKRIVDVGCGFGFIDTYLAQRYDCHITAVDFGAHHAGLTGISERLAFVSGDMLNLPIAARSADVAMCVEVLHHLEPKSINRALDQMCAILRPGGDMILFEPNRFHPLIIAISLADSSERFQLQLSIPRIKSHIQSRFEKVEVMPINYLLPTYKYKPPPLVEFFRPAVNWLEDALERNGTSTIYAVVAKGLKR